MDIQDRVPKHSRIEVFKCFLKLGLTSFGGPIAHIGYFRREFVQQRGWLTEEEFAHLVALCQFLPGPASSQLGLVIGLLRAQWIGALLAFIAFTLPSVVLLLIFASILPLLSGQIGQSVILGLKLVAGAVVAEAVIGMTKNLCKTNVEKMILVLSIVILLFVQSSLIQLVVILGGAMIGLMFVKVVRSKKACFIRVNYGLSTAVGLGAGFLTVFIALIVFKESHPLFAIAQSFFQAGSLVFGGGHVVLPLLQEGLVHSGQVSEQTLLAGYGAAQAVPGPMFSVAAYLGYFIPVDSYRLVGAFIALLFIFLPGFLLIAAIVPFWGKLSNNSHAAGALSGINAAVVGILAAALYDPIITTTILSASDAIIALLGFLLLYFRKSTALTVVWVIVLTKVTTTQIMTFF